MVLPIGRAIDNAHNCARARGGLEKKEMSKDSFLARASRSKAVLFIENIVKNINTLKITFCFAPAARTSRKGDV